MFRDVQGRREFSRRPFSFPHWSVYCLAALSATYLLQMATPLRLTPDVVGYLKTALDLGHGGRHPWLPSGYPFLVHWMDRVGLATPAGLVGLNCLSLAIGLAATYVVL